jgi:hypothetical protein
MSIVIETRPGSSAPDIRTPACVAVSVPRCRKGERAQKEITAILAAPEANELPKLEIVTGGSKCDSYGLEEIPIGRSFGDGRGFILWRSAEAIAKSGPDADDAYQTFISRNGQDDHCSCTGNCRFGYCKHCDALRGLFESGKQQDIGSIIPDQPHPSPEQVLHYAIVAPF